MPPILLSHQIRSIDETAVATHGVPSLVLMENAARGAFDVLLELVPSIAGARIAIVCGRGNNGGDGLALARHCLIEGARVECILLDEPERLSSDAAAQLAMLRSLAPDSVVRWSERAGSPPDADIVVDALLGTGATGAPRGDVAAAVEWINRADALRIALDLPTGVDADTGAVAGVAVDADVSLTMAALKPGLLLGPGRALSGAVYIVHIGVPETIYPSAALSLLDAELAASLLPPVDGGRHKYHRGRVLVAAGSRGMTGAAVMAAEAAARSGAGLTILALPEGALPLAQVVAPEIMTRALRSGATGAFDASAIDEIADEIDRYQAIAVGPGLSRDAGAAAFVEAILERATCLVVLDADGLSGYAGAIDRLAERTHPTVITPHHGEMARLLATSSDEVGADTLGVARDAASRSGAIVVLKGAPTVVALPDGRAWINAAGNPGMATGGTGDVLTGMIASLVAQTASVEAATLLGVHLHSAAADIAATTSTTRALLATDIIASIPAAYRALETEDAR